MADTDTLRARIAGVGGRSKLSWEESLARQLTGIWWGHGDPTDDVLNLGPGFFPGVGWRIITRTEAVAALARLGRAAGQRRELGGAAPSPLAVPAPGPARAAAVAVARERRPSIVERAVEQARRARTPRPPRFPRAPRARRRPRTPRAARPPRPPRPPRVPRVQGGPGQLWCYGVKYGFTLYPPPSARYFAHGVDPNTIPPYRGGDLWTKAGALSDCAQGLCKGPLGQWFQEQVRRLFPPPPPDPLAGLDTILKRAERRRQRRFVANPIPVVGNPPPSTVTTVGVGGGKGDCWRYKFQLYPPPNIRCYAAGLDPNTFAGQAGLWTKIT